MAERGIAEAIFEIQENKKIARDVCSMTLCGDTSALSKPGQFVNVQLPGLYLRRPISVCSYKAGEMVLIYKVVARGTKQMAGMQAGERLPMLVGLGNGFDIAPALGKRIALIGGGVGVPPLYGLMQALAGQQVVAVLGFGSADDVFYAEAFRALGAEVRIATVDGSLGQKGFVTDVLRDVDASYCFACGPEAMLRAVHATGLEGQLSFEARMACGFGACMGCTCHTIAGHKRICKDGPVLHTGEVTF